MTLAERLAGPDGLVDARCGHRVRPEQACRYEDAGQEPFVVCRSCCGYCSPIAVAAAEALASIERAEAVPH